MYLEHFGLDRPPFKITPDTSMFYEGSKRGAALDALNQVRASSRWLAR
jgi:MSHA biogenesis protein MshM